MKNLELYKKNNSYEYTEVGKLSKRVPTIVVEQFPGEKLLVRCAIAVSASAVLMAICSLIRTLVSKVTIVH
jgi:hypothetical protein